MYPDVFTEEAFALRLSYLRTQKKVSAREMSLSLGQNGSYINRIENLRTMPSMRLFFYICEYLEVTPKEFFDIDTINPTMNHEIIDELKKLNSKQLDTVLAVVKGFNHR